MGSAVGSEVGALGPWAPEPLGCPTAVVASWRRVPGACRCNSAGVCRRVMGDGELGRRGSDEKRQVMFLEAGGQVPGAVRAVGRVDDVPMKCASRRTLRNDRPGLVPFRVCYKSFAKGM